MNFKPDQFYTIIIGGLSPVVVKVLDHDLASNVLTIESAIQNQQGFVRYDAVLAAFEVTDDHVADMLKEHAEHEAMQEEMKQEARKQRISGMRLN